MAQRFNPFTQSRSDHQLVRRPVSHPLALARLRDAQLEDGSVSPLAAAIAIATHHHPTLNFSSIIETLARLAGEVRDMLAKNPGNAIAGIANHVLFDRHGFRGNRQNYNDAQNSYIDCVLKNRTGLPILLSLIYVEVVRRAGGTAHGIGLPGHFIVAVEENAQLTLIDPFHAGQHLQIKDCRDIVAAAGLQWNSEYLLPVDGRQWSLRMLANLRNVYAQMSDPANTAAVTEQMLLLAPTLPGLPEELTRLHNLLDNQAAKNN
jgi:regulator of sirC expression with transglutaminase-like and TPR domain